MRLPKRIRFPKFKHYFQNRALVLMYHRINTPASDPWKLSVDPELFEQQLIFFKKHYSVISSDELVTEMATGRIGNRSIVLTFDDGYRDNYETARPLLEKHAVPASFFITDSYLDGNQPFWWDELEYIIVHSKELPSVFSISMNNEDLHFNLADEAVLNEDMQEKHRKYNALKPPTKRTRLYLTLWNAFSPMQKDEQQQFLQLIRQWAGLSAEETMVDGGMSRKQLQELSANGLFTIGGHTSNHLALDHHSIDVQSKEISENKQFLEGLIGKEIHHFSYPSGKYNEATIKLLEENDYQAAYAGRTGPIVKNTDPFLIPRLQINNWNFEKFRKVLEKTFKS